MLKIHDDDTIDFTETFKVLYLNHSSQVVGCKTLSTGGITATCVDVRNIMQGALLTNATAMVLAHNHPSGIAEPSDDDDLSTKKFSLLCAINGVNLIDHNIYGGGIVYSYRFMNRMEKIKKETDVIRIMEQIKENHYDRK